MVKDLVTHTVGTVVAPGAVLLTMVPAGEELQAEVLVRNLDVGFVRVGQPARVKVATYPFQKYGLVDGAGRPCEPGRRRRARRAARRRRRTPRRCRTAIACAWRWRARACPSTARALPLASGMQVEAEIRLGERNLLEYLLAPVRKAWHEAARER